MIGTIHGISKSIVIDIWLDGGWLCCPVCSKEQWFSRDDYMKYLKGDWPRCCRTPMIIVRIEKRSEEPDVAEQLSEWNEMR